MLALVLIAIVTAAPADAKLELLKTFRDEFVAITPGEGDFPAAFEMGADRGPAAECPAASRKDAAPVRDRALRGAAKLVANRDG